MQAVQKICFLPGGECAEITGKLIRYSQNFQELGRQPEVLNLNTFLKKFRVSLIDAVKIRVTGRFAVTTYPVNQKPAG